MSELTQERLEALRRVAETATADELRAKVEELAGAAARVLEARWEHSCDQYDGLDDEGERCGALENALRAPGGATGKHPVVEGNRGSIAQKHDNEAVSPSRESRRAPGGGEW